MHSDISGFHKMGVEERVSLIKKLTNLTDEEVSTLKNFGFLGSDTANRMIENVIGVAQLPLGIATNFMINGKDYLVPMAIEEPSVVAAASNAAKIVRRSGGFSASSDEPIMFGQIQLVGVKDFDKMERVILKNADEIKEICNRKDSTLVKFGGGLKGIEFSQLDTEIGKMLIVNLLIDVRDAMGANAVNTMCEAVAPYLENITGCESRLKIISNLATKRLARARAVFSREALEESTGGKYDDVVKRIIEAYQFAKYDKFRCATHNKGIMNGVDAVVIATGNDFRAVEAGAHSFASISKSGDSGGYHPLTKYYKDGSGNLVGEIELPVAVGIVGGATRTNPIAKIALKILGVQTAGELSQVVASVGLAQNFAAMRALATEGIQRGHLKLHARNLVTMVGATGGLIDKIAERMIKENDISHSRAVSLLEEFRRAHNSSAASEI
ncbi:MAG: hydroxymethylglutaryl-CoA reductase, degradative [Candidatus Aenigmarchaeota archaeon]|nr:hydroxymethylglutaryl-CoA reductase, degradative [Candidatus Aenigmarchaeota archaeon]